jgi:succinate dehydrogenase/fumarate reductase flavoprotein subunit
VSTDENQKHEQEFLNDFFPDTGRLSTAIFSKGYEWPFDVQRIQNYGSSLIDILVYRETVQKKRKVFLDFRQNLRGKGTKTKFDFSVLDKKAFTYLQKSGVLFGTPVQRLRKLNEPAYRVFKDHGIDLEKEPLEIALCAQHNNGGLKGNIWWESNVKHLFPVGEVNGTHGARRPGGSSLNSCQVGGLRAAMFISKHYSQGPPHINDLIPRIKERVKDLMDFSERILSGTTSNPLSVDQVFKDIQQRMSSYGSIMRKKDLLSREKAKAWELLRRIKKDLTVHSSRELPRAFTCLDTSLTSAIYLEALDEYLQKGGKSRGSFLVMEPEGVKPCPELKQDWRYSVQKSGSFADKRILELTMHPQNSIRMSWVPIRPIPKMENWFETIWEDFRKDKID